MYGPVLKPLWWQLVPQAQSFVITNQLLCKYGCMDTSYQASIGSKARLSLCTIVVMCAADKLSSAVMQTQSCCLPEKLYMFSQAARKVSTCSCALPECPVSDLLKPDLTQADACSCTFT